MDKLFIIRFGILVVLTSILLIVGQRRHWGVTLVGLLGLGFIIPILVMRAGDM